MLVVLVSVNVKPEYLEVFRRATVENARHSVQEPGIERFDVIQKQDEPTRFILVEVYRSVEAQSQHKETAHYLKWRGQVQDWMAEPRVGVKYLTVFPEDVSV